jgi:hypothetical protein
LTSAQASSDDVVSLYCNPTASRGDEPGVGAVQRMRKLVSAMFVNVGGAG